MTPADKPKFVATLTGLAQVKPGAKLTPEALEIYWLSLEDWTLAEFQQAARHLAKNCEFMPNPYHFEQLRKAGEPTAGEAWAEVRAALRRMDYNNPPSISPRIDRVIRAMGGYRDLALANTDTLPFREKRFAELWEELGEAEQVRAALPSFHEKQPRLSGPQQFGVLAVNRLT